MKTLPPTSMSLDAHLHLRAPAIIPGLAINWPAVTRWSFKYLCGLAPDMPITLVKGKRENFTQYVNYTLGKYKDLLEKDSANENSLYLKEFNLLSKFPFLQKDISNFKGLLPNRFRAPRAVWIGPGGAKTGAHFDLFNNLAVVIRGSKKFYIAPPGLVESVGGLSSRYDRWAYLAKRSLSDICIDNKIYSSSIHTIILNAGDALYIPSHWWHEVENVTSSVLVSGFFNTYLSALQVFAKVGLREFMHRCKSKVNTDGCTCHNDNF